MHIGFWWGSQKERDQQEDVDVGGRIMIFGPWRDRMVWYGQE
jgi:hypothetical protein